VNKALGCPPSPMRGVLQHNKNWLLKFPNFSLRTTKSSRVGSRVWRRSFFLITFCFCIRKLPMETDTPCGASVDLNHDTSASLRGFVDFVLSEVDLSHCVSEATVKPTTVCQTQRTFAPIQRNVLFDFLLLLLLLLLLFLILVIKFYSYIRNLMIESESVYVT
jgi:hypothetical protein